MCGVGGYAAPCVRGVDKELERGHLGMLVILFKVTKIHDVGKLSFNVLVRFQ